MEKANRNIYIPQWHVEEILYFLCGHIFEGDVTRTKFILAIYSYMADLQEKDIVENVLG